MTEFEPVTPWLWMVCTSDGQVLGYGRQWTRLHETPQRVAEERIAAWAWLWIRDGRASELAGVECHVKRSGSEVPPVVASAHVWASRAAARPRV